MSVNVDHNRDYMTVIAIWQRFAPFTMYTLNVSDRKLEKVQDTLVTMNGEERRRTLESETKVRSRFKKKRKNNCTKIDLKK